MSVGVGYYPCIFIHMIPIACKITSFPYTCGHRITSTVTNQWYEFISTAISLTR